MPGHIVRLKLNRCVGGGADDHLLELSAGEALSDAVANGVGLLPVRGDRQAVDRERQRLAEVGWGQESLHGEAPMEPLLPNELRSWEPDDLEEPVPHLLAALDVLEFVYKAMRSGDEVAIAVGDEA